MTSIGAATSAIAAGFVASFVECVEALTIVLAVGAARGWRGALTGAGSGLLLLLVALAAFGRALAAVPENLARIVIGALLLAFGLRWLLKAIRRAAGRLRLRDEGAIYAARTEQLGTVPQAGALDRVAVATAFQVVMIEGVEVVFIVLSLAATRHGLLAPAAMGAAAALLAVSLLGVVLHRPLSRVPENGMKLIAGVLLCAFGIHALGEGAGFAWPFGDGSLLALAAAFAAGTAVAIGVLKRAGAAAQ